MKVRDMHVAGVDNMAEVLALEPGSVKRKPVKRENVRIDWRVSLYALKAHVLYQKVEGQAKYAEVLFEPKIETLERNGACTIDETKGEVQLSWASLQIGNL
jgi:hypothetical protein